jgi:hypothetical protein
MTKQSDCYNQKQLSDKLNQHDNQANEKHENGNPINAVHHARIEVVFTFPEYSGRIEVGEDSSNKHGRTDFFES